MNRFQKEQDLGAENRSAVSEIPGGELTIRGHSDGSAQAAKCPDNAADLCTTTGWRALLRKRLSRRLTTLFSTLTGLRLHVVWLQDQDISNRFREPPICPRARRLVSSEGKASARCKACMRKHWFAGLHHTAKGSRFRCACGCTCFRASLKIQDFCPMTLMLQAPVEPRTDLGSGGRVQSAPGPRTFLFGQGGLPPPDHNRLRRPVPPKPNPSLSEVVTPTAFNHAVALLRFLLRDLEQAVRLDRLQRELDNALRVLRNLQLEDARLRQELHSRLPDLPEHPALPGTESHLQDISRQMLGYVHEHYHYPMSLKEVAGNLGMSASYLSTLFTQATGIHFHCYLDEFRLSKAKELLRNPLLHVSEVAEAVGYASADWFRHAFKAHTGYSPSEWRASRG